MTPKMYVGSIDQGTTSSRFILFDVDNFTVVGKHQIEHKQITPKPGMVEHDPYEILEKISICIEETLKKTSVKASSIISVGITNQRETTLIWSRSTGKVLYNALVWQDTRTQDICDLWKEQLTIERINTIQKKNRITYFYL